MTEHLLGTDRPLHEAFDLALVDLDGVTYRGPEVITSAPPALAAARSAGMQVVFVTNNASRTPEEVASHLTEVGITARPAEVLTAALAAADVLRRKFPEGSRVLVVGGRGLREAVEEVGFTVVEKSTDDPAAVVQGWYPDLAWKHLAEAAYAVRSGAYYLATNRDLTLPNERGLAPGNGSMVRAVVTASGIEPESFGKPAPTMFHLAAERVGASRPLVIGDRLDTDLGGAVAAGFPGLLVLTGVSQVADLLAAGPEERPSFVGADLSSLGEVHEAPRILDGWWSVADTRARVARGALEMDGPRGLNLVRSACAAVWEARDEGNLTGLEPDAAERLRYMHG